MSTRTPAKSSSKVAGQTPRAFEASGFILIDTDLNVVKAPPAIKRTAVVKEGGHRIRVRKVEPINLERMLNVVMAAYKRVTKVEPAIDEQALLQAMSTDLAEAAQESSPATAVDAGWQALLLKSLADKTQLLASTKFRSTSAAATVLGIQEPAIRKRIRDCRLFALTMPGSDEYRIPVWALGLTADDTKALVAAEDDAWALYLYLETPSGALNGMRPFELLLPMDSLTSEQKGKRQALLAFRGLPDRGSLLSLVVQDLESDKAPTA